MSELVISALAILTLPIILFFIIPLFNQVFNSGFLDVLREGFSYFNELFGSQVTNIFMIIFCFVIFMIIVRWIFSFFGSDR